MKCPYCKKEALWCENKEIYGQNYGQSYMCYLCKDCNAYVGCHHNSKKSLGTMANAELREWRKKVHRYLDPLWKEGAWTRKKLYKNISHQLGINYHTGFADIELCKKVLSLKFKDLTSKKSKGEHDRHSIYNSLHPQI